MTLSSNQKPVRTWTSLHWTCICSGFDHLVLLAFPDPHRMFPHNHHEFACCKTLCILFPQQSASKNVARVTIYATSLGSRVNTLGFFICVHAWGWPIVFLSCNGPVPFWCQDYTGVKNDLRITFPEHLNKVGKVRSFKGGNSTSSHFVFHHPRTSR